MKQRKRVTKRAAKGVKRPQKVMKIHARAGSGRRFGRSRRGGRYLPEELAGMYRPVKRPVTLRLDADIVAWFQQEGRGYQTRINEALRKAMMEGRR